MPKEYWSPGVGEGVGTLVENRRERSRGTQRWRAAVLAVLGLVLHAACATGYPMGGTLAGNDRHRRPPLAKSPDAKKRAAKVLDGVEAEGEASTVAPDSRGAGTEDRVARGRREGSAAEGKGSLSRLRRQARRAGEAENWEGEGVGWSDGVGDGRPYAVPMSLDYFQGFLVQAGVPSTAMPEDGNMLSPQQALELLPHLLATPVTLVWWRASTSLLSIRERRWRAGRRFHPPALALG